MKVQANKERELTDITDSLFLSVTPEECKEFLYSVVSYIGTAEKGMNSTALDGKDALIYAELSHYFDRIGNVLEC